MTAHHTSRFIITDHRIDNPEPLSADRTIDSITPEPPSAPRTPQPSNPEPQSAENDIAPADFITPKKFWHGRGRYNAALTTTRHAQSMRALDLRTSGASFDTIASECGYKSPHAAYTAVRAAMSRQSYEKVEELRAVELWRLDIAQRAIWSQVQSGFTDAIDAYLKIVDKRARIAGTYAPTKISHTDPTGSHESQSRTVSELAAKLSRLATDLSTTALPTQGEPIAPYEPHPHLELTNGTHTNEAYTNGSYTDGAYTTTEDPETNDPD